MESQNVIVAASIKSTDSLVKEISHSTPRIRNTGYFTQILGVIHRKLVESATLADDEYFKKIRKRFITEGVMEKSNSIVEKVKYAFREYEIPCSITAKTCNPAGEISKLAEKQDAPCTISSGLPLKKLSEKCSYPIIFVPEI